MKLLSNLAAVALLFISQFAMALPDQEKPASVNINNANAAQLAEVLVGIGERRAIAIVEYRNQHGEFISLDELLAVKGVGEKMIEANRDRISFGE